MSSFETIKFVFLAVSGILGMISANMLALPRLCSENVLEFAFGINREAVLDEKQMRELSLLASTRRRVVITAIAIGSFATYLGSYALLLREGVAETPAASASYAVAISSQFVSFVVLYLICSGFDPIDLKNSFEHRIVSLMYNLGGVATGDKLKLALNHCGTFLGITAMLFALMYFMVENFYFKLPPLLRP